MSELDKGWFHRVGKRAEEHLAQQDPKTMGRAARLLTDNQLCANCDKLPGSHAEVGDKKYCSEYEPGESKPAPVRSAKALSPSPYRRMYNP